MKRGTSWNPMFHFSLQINEGDCNKVFARYTSSEPLRVNQMEKKANAEYAQVPAVMHVWLE